ncbi:hypothetical protein HMI54_006381 [Coelomomyces lativittatus]|nr:hypothetical protein HMI55_000944 [Coelomomyces lativittatus]KAJ1513234.1 hypothetical protein HMI56_002811 [Coelomomyces lativittatus]KAJ1517249.1 hypothetical protein HMI54_006381 [Coelomomyces lativittatus]
MIYQSSPINEGDETVLQPTSYAANHLEESNNFRKMGIAIGKGHLVLLLCFFLARACFTPIVPLTGLVTFIGTLFFFFQGIMGAFDQFTSNLHSATLTSIEALVDFYVYWATFYFFLFIASCLPVIDSILRISTWHFKWPMLINWFQQEPFDVYTSWSFALFPFLLVSLESIPSLLFTRASSSNSLLYASLRSSSTVFLGDSDPSQDATKLYPTELVSRWLTYLFSGLLVLHLLISLPLLLLYGANSFSTLVLGTAVAYCWIWLIFNSIRNLQNSGKLTTWSATITKFLEKHD